MTFVRTVVAMSLIAVAATADGYGFQGLSYSNSGTVRTGEWTCRYKLAKSLASANDIPMVVVWVSPTCTYCKSLASALGGSAAFKKWMAQRNYVMVFAVGQTSSSTYGTEESDVSAAYSFTEVGISKFPFVGLWWRRNASGAEVKKRFTGRSGLMPSKSGSLVQQFMDSVDQYLGAYAGAGGTISGDDPDIPAPAPSGKTCKVTFNANGGSSDEKSRKVQSGEKVGTLPTATRKGYLLEGWFTKSKGGEKVSASTAVTRSVTYYAHWEKVNLLSVSVSPGGGGDVSGGGAFPDGKKATAKATPAPGHCFAGWRIGDDLVSRSPRYSCLMDGKDVVLTADFVPLERDLASVTLAVDGKELDSERIVTNVVRCGVQLRLPVAADALSGVSVKASGLPPGLKLVRTPVSKELKEYAYEISGTPSSASKASSKTGLVKPTVAKIKVTTLGGNAVTYRHAFVVEALPSWAYGSFSGFAAADGRGSGVGVAKLTVSAGGKISGKFAISGTSWSFSATGYSESDDAKTFACEVLAGHSKQKRPVVLRVTPGVCNCSCADGTGDDTVVKMHRTVWKDKPALPSPKMVKTEIAAPKGFDNLFASVSASGKVKFVGKSSDGDKISSSSTVFIDSDEKRKAFLIVPRSNKTSAYFETIEFEQINDK